MKLLTIAVLSAMMTWGSSLLAADNDAAMTTYTQAQIAQLEQLHAAFHRAASVHDTVNGDSTAEIEIRIRQILSLWTTDAVLQLSTGSTHDGYYRGRGNPSDPSTCPTPSGKPANQGTLCTLFTYVAGSFQAASKYISLSPVYKTHYQVSGTSARFYFECHYFDVDESAGTAQWTPEAHLALSGTARKINGQWRFWHAVAPKVAVPVP
jgi:hypothetical protein